MTQTLIGTTQEEASALLAAILIGQYPPYKLGLMAADAMIALRLVQVEQTDNQFIIHLPNPEKPKAAEPEIRFPI